MSTLNLIDSPRLYVTSDVAANLQDKLHSPFLQSLAERVLHDADGLPDAPVVKEGEKSTYQHGTRLIDSQLQCLTSAWVLTGDVRYREAAIRHLGGLRDWNHISCEANASIPAEKELPFCLSYGELSQTVGLMYDLFRRDMTDAEREVFVAVLNRFLMREAVKCLDNPPWWANKGWSNWNGVCCGGMGVMALAFYDDIPEAPRLIPFVEKSLDPYFKSYIDNDGGCPEGTGYWNYGMNYAMRYVLSWENATGKQHPALEIEQLRKSLLFPLDFTGISFGDNDGWGPTAFFFLLADRLNMKHAALNAAAYLAERVNPIARQKRKKRADRATGGDLLYAADAIPTAEEIAELKKSHQQTKVPVARIYRGMDWAALADDEAFPTLRMAIRGGSSAIAGHGMLDLLSFRCRVNGELMITDQADTGYLTTTFGRRGTDIYSRNSASKSTLFVEGLGCGKDATCEQTEIIQNDDDITGVRIEVTKIYLPRLPAQFIGRLFLFVNNEYWLVVDHVLSRNEVTHLGIESRFHTYADCVRDGNQVALKFGDEQMQMTFAALQPGIMQESYGMPPRPAEQTRIFRWMGKERVADNLHVVALNPGPEKLGLQLTKEDADSYLVGVTAANGDTRRIWLSSDLKLK